MLGQPGLEVFVAGAGGRFMQVLRRGSDLSLISCLAHPTAALFAAVEALGRVKHLFRLDSNGEDDAEWMRHFSPVYWSPTVGRGVDCLLTRDALLPFPGRVWVFDSVARSEVVLFVAQLQLAIAARSLPCLPRDNEHWILSQQRAHPQSVSLAHDYESVLVTLRFERVLTAHTSDVVERTKVVKSIVALNERGLLTGTVGRPFSRWASALWLVLFVLNVALLFAYLVSRGSLQQLE